MGELTYVTIRGEVRPVRRHGFDLWVGEVVDDRGMVWFSTQRWSREQAWTDTQRFIQENRTKEVTPW
jgi:hypothetical protein